MKIVKGVAFVVLVVVVAAGVFNGVFVVASIFFGPFYEGDAQQSRNFAVWLVGNGVVVLVAAVGGVVWFFRCLRGRRR